MNQRNLREVKEKAISQKPKAKSQFPQFIIKNQQLGSFIFFKLSFYLNFESNLILTLKNYSNGKNNNSNRFLFHQFGELRTKLK